MLSRSLFNASSFLGIKMSKIFYNLMVILFATLSLSDCLSIPRISSTNDDKANKQILPATANPEDSLPNLRKILYPTYAREPYGADIYT